MKLVYRTAIIVTPREPFFDWARGIDADANEAVDRLSPDEFSSVFLIEQAEDLDPDQVIRQHFATIFAEQLNHWHRDEAKWPKRRNRTESLFREWFEVRFIESIWDLVRGPIEPDE